MVDEQAPVRAISTFTMTTSFDNAEAAIAALAGAPEAMRLLSAAATDTRDFHLAAAFVAGAAAERLERAASILRSLAYGAEIDAREAGQ